MNNLGFKPLVLAVLVVTTPLAAVARAQGPKTPAAPVTQPAPAATKVPIAAKAPEDRIIYDNATVTPVVDDVSRHRTAARSAFESEEPQRHFTNAVAAYARRDYKAAGADIRKAVSYLRLEAGRATGEVKQELDSSVAQLDRLATAVEKGAAKDQQSMARDFAKANHALALEHRSKAAESWAHKQYDKTGYELKAAAHGLESAASWAGREEKTDVSVTVAEIRALGDKLVSGATWTRDEVAKGFESLGNSINALGQKIGATRKASPFNVGA